MSEPNYELLQCEIEPGYDLSMRDEEPLAVEIESEFVIDPYISVEQTEEGAVFTCTDATGTTTALVKNGKDGEPGKDGFSPEVSVSEITGGHEVAVTDKNGTQTFDVMDGKDGEPGATPEIFTAAVTLAPGASAYAHVSGTPEQPLVTFGIPAGEPGTTDYDDLSDKPSINSVTLSGNKTLHELGIAAESDIPSVPVQSVNGQTGDVELDAADVGAYELPSGGIPKSDLDSNVQTSLGKADTALQSAPVASVNSQTGDVEITAAGIGAYVLPADGIPSTDLEDSYAKGVTANGEAYRTVSIPYGEVDSTSTNTAYTVTVPGINELRDGVVCYIRNDVVTSTTNFTLNVNGLGAKPVYQNAADATRIASTFTSAVTWLFIYNEKRVSGGCWDAYYGYVNSNTIGYQVRTNSSTLPVSDRCYRYRLLFTSADGTKYVPANDDTQTSAAKTHTTCTTPIDPFGSIFYYGTTTALSAGSNPSKTILWQQYVVTLGYSFNNANAALTLTANTPVYIRCTPNADGSAVLDYFTQALPSTNDGKIYIFLGIAVDATTVEVQVNHPVYYHNGTGIRRWVGGN